MSGLFTNLSNFVSLIGNQNIDGIKNFIQNLGLGVAIPQAKLHIDSGNATGSAIKFTAGTTTGQATTDGFNIGISNSGTGEIRQLEYSSIDFFTNNISRMSIDAIGDLYLGRNANILANTSSNSTTTGALIVSGGVGVSGNLFAQNIGLGTPSVQARLNIDSGTATASAIKFTAGTTTGQTATDGFDIGISSTGAAEIRQRENNTLSFFTNNNARLTIDGAGLTKFSSGNSLGSFYANPINIYSGLDIENDRTSIALSPNRLANANNRFFISSSNVVNIGNLFDNNFDTVATINQNQTGTFTIDFTSENFAFSNGALVLTFVSANLAQSILIETQNQSQVASNEWTTLVSLSSNTRTILHLNYGLGSSASANPVKLRATLSSITNNISIAEIEWFSNRPNLGEIGYLPQHQSGTINSNIGTLRLLSTTASTSSTTGALVVSGGVGISGSLVASQFRLSALTAPASTNAPGLAGEIKIDANFIYVCVATNSWKRTTLSTW